MVLVDVQPLALAPRVGPEPLEEKGNRAFYEGMQTAFPGSRSSFRTLWPRKAASRCDSTSPAGQRRFHGCGADRTCDPDERATILKCKDGRVVERWIDRRSNGTCGRGAPPDQGSKPFLLTPNVSPRPVLSPHTMSGSPSFVTSPISGCPPHSVSRIRSTLPSVSMK